MLQRCTRRDTQDFIINSDIAIDQQVRNSSCSYVSLFPRFFQQTASAVLRISIPQAMLAFASQHLFPETGEIRFAYRAKLALAELVLQEYYSTILCYTIVCYSKRYATSQ